MDSDCLIKIAKSSIKEIIVKRLRLYITPLVAKETVENVRGRNYPDASLIAGNIDNKKLKVSKKYGKKAQKGEYEILTEFKNGKYDAIASDDTRFLKILKSLSIPYLTPAAIIVLLKERKFITSGESVKMLDKLSPYINREQYLAARMLL